VLDQSFMLRPDLTPHRWALPLDGPIQKTWLSERAISTWMGKRFEN
jgi:hypothetical protein